MAFAEWNAPEPVLALVLTKEEAEFLLAVTQKIGGNSETTYRHMSDDLSRALKNVGIENKLYTYLRPGEYGGITAADII